MYNLSLACMQMTVKRFFSEIFLLWFFPLTGLWETSKIDP